MNIAKTETITAAPKNKIPTQEIPKSISSSVSSKGPQPNSVVLNTTDVQDKPAALVQKSKAPESAPKRRQSAKELLTTAALVGVPIAITGGIYYGLTFAMPPLWASFTTCGIAAAGIYAGIRWLFSTWK